MTADDNLDICTMVHQMQHTWQNVCAAYTPDVCTHEIVPSGICEGRHKSFGATVHRAACIMVMGGNGADIYDVPLHTPG